MHPKAPFWFGLNAGFLIVSGMSGYFLSQPPIPTNLVPVFFGLVFLFCTPLLKHKVKFALPLLLFLSAALIYAMTRSFIDGIYGSSVPRMVQYFIMLATTSGVTWKIGKEWIAKKRQQVIKMISKSTS